HLHSFPTRRSSDLVLRPRGNRGEQTQHENDSLLHRRLHSTVSTPCWSPVPILQSVRSAHSHIPSRFWQTACRLLRRQHGAPTPRCPRNTGSTRSRRGLRCSI